VTGQPLVTVAFPLHRSAPYVEIVLANIAAVDIAGAEIIVSDRTVLDDAAARIAEATAPDHRVRVIAEPAGLGWAEHYSLLLREGHGRYLVWLPHDDDFPQGYVRRLVEALEDDPAAVVAFGDIDASGGGAAKVKPDRTFGRGPLRAADAAHLFTHWTIGAAFRGVLRRDVLVAEAIDVRRRPPDDAWSDDLFMLEVALSGGLVHVTGVVSHKRFHPDSAHASWRATPGRTLRLHLEALAILWRRGRDRTLPVAALLVARRWLGYLVMAGRRRWGHAGRR
jgi:GT2 family glycosyltransferase